MRISLYKQCKCNKITKLYVKENVVVYYSMKKLKKPIRFFEFFHYLCAIIINFSMKNGELKERILNTSYEMFAQRGTKGVTMDNISSELAISKRTLYEIFSSKSELLSSIVEMISDKNIKIADEVHKKEISSLEKIFHIAFINKEAASYQDILFKDLMANYPEILNQVTERMANSEIVRFLGCIEQGGVEGDINPNINFEMPVYMLFATRFSLNSQGAKKTITITAREMRIYTIIFFLRSIASQQGLKNIDRLCELYDINIYKK